MEFFLFMTGSASLLILSALLLRPLTGRVLPRALQMALWISASLRLLLPVNIRTPFSILALFSALRPAAEPLAGAVPHTPAPSLVPAPALSVVPDPVLPAVSDPAVPLSPAEPAASLSFLELLPWIWLCGALLTTGILLTLHLLEMRRCGAKTRDPEAERQTSGFVRVFRCRTTAPFTAGLFRPRILLPETLPASDLPAILAHECAHIRGLDILKKHLFAAALCVNWFNPLVWVMVYLAARDLEILCDARALRRPDAPDAKTYAHALLNAEERRTLFTLGFSNHTEVRIMKILKKDKHNRILMLVSVLLVALLVTACTTAAEPAQDLPEPETSTESETSSSETEATPTPPPAEDAAVQTMSNEKSAETVQDLFMKDGVHGFGGLQTGMSWEEAKPIIAEMTGIENPTLPEIRDYRTYIAFPYVILGYEGTVTVTFTTNTFQLTAIECTLSSEGEDAVEAAYSSIYEQLYAQFASPTESYDTAKNHIWYFSDCSLALGVCPTGTSFSTMGLGINTDHTGTESVQIGIYPNYSEENTEAVYEGEEYVRFPVRSESDAHTALFFIENEITQLNMEKERITQLMEAPEQTTEEYAEEPHFETEIISESEAE